MLGDITLGQYYPGNSFVHRLDPRTKILVTLLLIVAIFLAQSVPAYVALWVMVFFVIAISKLPFLLVFKSVKPLLFIILRPCCTSGSSSASPRKASPWASRCPCASCCSS